MTEKFSIGDHVSWNSEVGRVSGGEVTTFNTFSGSEPGAARNYGSVGLRFGF